MNEYESAIVYFERRLRLSKEAGGVGKHTRQRHFFEVALNALKAIDHDGCRGCAYSHLKATDNPCNKCRSAYLDMYEPLLKMIKHNAEGNDL